MNNSKHDVCLYVGDNNSQDTEMQEWLRELNQLDKVEVTFFKENKGKAHAINEMYKRARKADYFISVDSDMLADQEDKYSFVDEMVWILENDENIGMVSSKQTGNDSHWHANLKNKFMVGEHHVEATLNGSGIAGGCIMLRSKEFESLGLYTVYDVYCGDDALLLQNVHRGLNKIGVVSMDVSLRHTENEDYETEYQQWKINKAYGKIAPNASGGGFFCDPKNRTQKKRIALYTAIIGGYDPYRLPKISKDANIDVYLFTDCEVPSIDGVTVIEVDVWNNDPTRTARQIKIKPHEFLPGYEAWIWVDGSIVVDTDFAKLEELLDVMTTDMRILEHRGSDGIYHEASLCQRMKLDDVDLIQRQVDRYKEAGYEKYHPMVETGVMIRKNTDAVKAVMDEWWEEVKNFSKRDQISFSYVAWKHKFQFEYILPLFKNNFFSYGGHNA
jgi:glycosyltransferase involved in cell wall biosynthesis